MPQRLRTTDVTPRDALRDIVGVMEAKLIVAGKVHVGAGARVRVREPGAVRALSSELVARALDQARLRALGSRAENVLEEVLEFVRYGGRVCVPGSTIKGLVRSRLELMAGLRGAGDVSSACLVTRERPLYVEPRKGAQGWRHARVWGGSVRVDREPDLFGEEEGYPPCPVCNLLGAPGLASRVLFGNFCAEGVSVVRETVDRSILEVVRGPAELTGSVTLRSLSPGELGLLLIGMGYDCEAFRFVLLGRFKYSRPDFGEVRFEVTGLRLARTQGLESIATSIGLSLRGEGRWAVLEGDELARVLRESCRRALESFSDVAPLSEAEERRRLGKELWGE